MEHEIYVGAIDTMQMIAARGVKGLNPKTHKWQIVSKTVGYAVVPDPKIAGGASLMSNQDLRTIAKERGLII